MAKKVGQIRWFGDNKSQNYPSDITLAKLRYGTAFPKTNPIVQIGIQTLPGTKIYLNAHTVPVIIGATGIYELSVDGLANLTSVQFDNASLQIIENNPSAYIIIDYIYEE